MDDFLLILAVMGIVAAGSFWCGYSAARKKFNAPTDGWNAYLKMTQEAHAQDSKQS